MSDCAMHHGCRASVRTSTRGKRAIAILRLGIVVVLALPLPALAQLPSPGQRPTPGAAIWISAQDMPADALREIVRVLASTNEWTGQHVLAVNDNLSKITADSFGFGRIKAPAWKYLMDTIQVGNQIRDPKRMQIGDTVKLPIIPRVELGYTAVQEWRQGERAISLVEGGAVVPGLGENQVRIVGDSALVAKIGLIAFSTPASARAAVEEPDEQLSSYDMAYYTWLPPQASEEDGDSASHRSTDPIPATGGSLKAPGRLVILDFFGSNDCKQPTTGHGRRVVAHAKAMLNALGASSLAPSIAEIDLDFRRNPDWVVRLVKQQALNRYPKDPGYLADQEVRVRKMVDAARNNLDAIPPASMMFLSALLDSLMRDPGVALISMSVSVPKSHSWLVPPVQPSGVQRPVLVAPSAQSDERLLAEAIDASWARRQPQQTLAGIRTTVLTSFLVDVLDKKGRPQGFFGPPINALEVSQGHRGDCLNIPPDGGTSYSAPRIAALVFTAQATWAARGVPVPDGEEIDSRMRLSARIQSQLEGKYGVAGTPIPQLFLAGTGINAVSAAGVTVTLSRAAELVVCDRRETQILGGSIGGIAFESGGTYVYSYAKKSWMKRAVTGIGLSAAASTQLALPDRGHACAAETLADVAKAYQRVVVFR